ncbi:MAG: phosphoribosylanthranilate isomerase [Chitinophagaceae bacterium]
MRVKVCGMTSIEQIRLLDQLGVEFAGMIFYPNSPRYIRKFSINANDLKREKLNINRVGVFVNASLDEILKEVDEWRLHMVQLHGDESPKFCEQVSNHVTTIKAFRVSEDDDLEWKIYPYHPFVDMYLFDSGWKGNTTRAVEYGGTGLHFNWDLIEKTNMVKPFFLSGGIGLDDIDSLTKFESRQKNLFAVDVNSKFEVSPGIKDMNMIASFMESLKNNKTTD